VLSRCCCDKADRVGAIEKEPLPFRGEVTRPWPPVLAWVGGSVKISRSQPACNQTTEFTPKILQKNSAIGIKEYLNQAGRFSKVDMCVLLLFARNLSPLGSGTVAAHSSTRFCFRAMLKRAPLSIQDCILMANRVGVL
jgi:hypothetical protein